MKQLIRSVIIWAVILCLVPAAAKESAPDSTAVQEETQIGLLLPRDSISILYEDSGSIVTMDIEEYAVYAALGQIPYVLEPEAMKAQVCAARTYAAQRILYGTEESGADITDDSSLYQVCLTEHDARAVYGGEYESVLAAARSTALDTKGIIITYDGSPITAAFHTASADMTESSENVWGIARPYLTAVQAVESPITSVYTFTAAEINARLSAEFPNAAAYIGANLDHSPSGTVLSASICGITTDGRTLARILTLDSAAFDISEADDSLIFTVKGSGNLSGMSILGADELARQGKNYEEILAYYYPGTDLCSLSY